MAWQLTKQFGNFAEALKQAWKVIKLKAQMSLGIVKFSFKKVDGSIRNAVGTLKQELINYEYKGSGNVSNEVVAYYDMESEAFRSFRIGSLI